MTIYYKAENRKPLVQAVSEFTGATAVYMRTPTYAYQIDYFTVTREGNLEFDDRADSEEIEGLIEFLAEKGFVAEETPDTAAQDADEEETAEAFAEPETEPQEAEIRGPRQAGRLVGERTSSEMTELSASAGSEGYGACKDALTVALPREDFTDGALENLRKLVDSKSTLMKKALAVEKLPIEVTAEKVSFPWFSEADSDSAKAYTHFIAALCNMAKNQKRITAKEKAAENEKYAFRCFLLRLGFIGTEYKTDRKILLQNLSGNSAFKSGEAKTGEEAM